MFPFAIPDVSTVYAKDQDSVFAFKGTANPKDPTNVSQFVILHARMVVALVQISANVLKAINILMIPLLAIPFVIQLTSIASMEFAQLLIPAFANQGINC